MGFQTMPYLFENWGPVLAAIAGVFWFGLLFFAGITSSLAMGTPWMGFMEDEFQWSRGRSAWSFGGIVLLLGLPTVFFYQYGVFNEYDYWAGTVALVLFALAESIVFAWIYGIDRGWEEITRGADMKVPIIYRFVIKYVTPVFLLFVFVGSVFSPKGGDWNGALASLFSGNGWSMDDGSLTRMFLNSGLHDRLAAATDPAEIAALETQLWYIYGSRLLLTLAFLGLCALVYYATRKRAERGAAL
jgi:hypothetical protein